MVKNSEREAIKCSCNTGQLYSMYGIAYYYSAIPGPLPSAADIVGGFYDDGSLNYDYALNTCASGETCDNFKQVQFGDKLFYCFTFNNETLFICSLVQEIALVHTVRLMKNSAVKIYVVRFSLFYIVVIYVRKSSNSIINMHKLNHVSFNSFQAYHVISFNLAISDMVLLYRFFNNAIRSNLLVTDPLVIQQYRSIPAMGNLGPIGAVIRRYITSCPTLRPIHHIYSPTQMMDFYTINEEVYQQRLRQGYQNRGIIGYAVPGPRQCGSSLAIFDFYSAAYSVVVQLQNSTDVERLFRGQIPGVIRYSMKVVALLSGGKDSCFNLMKCVENGHQATCVANLRPPDGIDDLESYMFQTVGHEGISTIAEVLELPLISRTIHGSSSNCEIEYFDTTNDEVEDMKQLLLEAKKLYNVEAVSSGAIASNYQKNRIDYICERIDLESLTYLWQRDQVALLNDMMEQQLDAVIVKTASMGLLPNVYLGKTVRESFEKFLQLKNDYGFNVCGEGGEYETMVVHCPLFKRRIVIEHVERVINESNCIAPVGYLKIHRMRFQEYDLNFKWKLIQRKMSNVSTSKILPYASCLLCRQSGRAEFKSAAEFIDHLRTMHCTKEGGSYICHAALNVVKQRVLLRYGPYNVCRSLPVEGVADKDYEEHIRKVHLPDDGKEELAKLLQSMRFTENVSTSNQPSLVQDSIQPKNVYSLAQNLSAALNDPRKPRHLTSQFFTRHWGESFVETAEPPPLYNHRARHRRHLKDERKILKRFKKSQSVSGESEIATSTLNIPELFCSSSFCLKNVTCFNALIQLAEQSSQDGKASANLVGFPKEWTASLLTEQSLRSYKLFQEKLGHYLDSVEIDIAYHLSKKSSSFFQLMTSHDQLRKLLLNAITVANILRQQVHCIDEMLCSRWLRLIYLKQRRARCAMLAAKLDLVNAVSQTQATVQSLLASSDYLAALELIATTRAVLNEELKGVICFRHLHSELTEIEELVCRILLEEFLNFMRSEFKEPMYNDDAVLEFDLIFGVVIMYYVQVAREEINVIHRLPPTDTEKKYLLACSIILCTEIGKFFSLAEEMRNFTFDVWLDVFTKIASAVLRFCKKLKIVLERICALIDYAIHKSTADDCSLNRATTAAVQPANLLNDVCLSQYDADTLHDTVEEFLPQACTYAEERLCRVLSARGKDVTPLQQERSSRSYLSLSYYLYIFVG
ncbi:conserved hypothetical protein, partial [Trichinella spiralis]|uniref:hypothetical protein n=1 Tax=Trichinella spiralis TaxID=6334 RepID=UPI0001EFB7FE